MRPRQRPGDAADGRRPAITGSTPQVVEDENTGGGDQAVLVRRTRARLLLSDQDHTGYEVLPLARVVR